MVSAYVDVTINFISVSHHLLLAFFFNIRQLADQEIESVCQFDEFRDLNALYSRLQYTLLPPSRR